MMAKLHVLLDISNSAKSAMMLIWHLDVPILQRRVTDKCQHHEKSKTAKWWRFHLPPDADWRVLARRPTALNRMALIAIAQYCSRHQAIGQQRTMQEPVRSAAAAVTQHADGADYRLRRLLVCQQVSIKLAPTSGVSLPTHRQPSAPRPPPSSSSSFFSASPHLFGQRRLLI